MDRKGTQSFFFKGSGGRPPTIEWILVLITIILIAGLVFRMAQEVWLSP